MQIVSEHSNHRRLEALDTIAAVPLMDRRDMLTGILTDGDVETLPLWSMKEYGEAEYRRDGLHQTSAYCGWFGSKLVNRFAVM